MPVKNNREYRSFIEFRTNKEAGDYHVTGYASTFEKYELFEFDGASYCERIDPHAFDEADMSDVIFQYNHEGMVYARTSNGTLKIEIDDIGLKIDADLSSTAQTRELYDQIEKGLTTKMSFAFTVQSDGYEDEGRTRIIYKVKKVYDVSAVSLPANPTTEIGISPRSLFNGAIEKEQAERLEIVRKAKALKALKLRLKMEEITNGNQ